MQHSQQPDHFLATYAVSFNKMMHEVLPAFREQLKLLPTVGEQAVEITMDVVLSANDCWSSRIRKRLKAHNAIVYTVTSKYHLVDNCHITMSPISIALKNVEHNGKRPALKKLERYIANPKVMGYQLRSYLSNAA